MCENAKLKRKEVPQLEHGEDVVDILTRKTAQLSSMLVTITGTGFESFITYNDEIKGEYLWACADLACQIKILSGHVH